MWTLRQLVKFIQLHVYCTTPQCEMRNEPFFDQWLEEGFDDLDDITDGAGVEDEAGSDIKGILAAYFMICNG